jgi:hypothetical protein
MSLLLALAATTLSYAQAPQEVRQLSDDLNHLRVDVPAGTVTVTRDPAVQVAELRTTQISWQDGCTLGIAGTLRTRVYVEKPFLSRVTCELGVELAVPPGVDVSVRLGSGEVELNKLASAVSVNIGEGALHLNDVRGDLTVRMDQGTISGTHSSKNVDVVLNDEKMELKGTPLLASEDTGGTDDAG